MATNRKRSRIEVELPPDIQANVNRLLTEQKTYEEVAEYLREEGYDISRSSVGRYGKDFFKLTSLARVFEAKAKALVDGQDMMTIEHATSKLLIQEVLTRLMNGEINITEAPRILSDVAKLQSSSIQRNRYLREIRERVEKVAETVEKKVTKAGVSKEIADMIKRDVLGIAK